METVTVNPVPVCTITGNTTICQGQSTQLCSPGGATSYLWSTGATTNCITVSAAGTYSVTVTGVGGCTSVCSATVVVNPVPVCTITGNTTVCQGQSTQLCTAAGATSYLWSTGATTNCITVNAAGTYSVTVTGVGGCSSVCSATVVVNPVPVCTITGGLSICQGQSTQLCTAAGATSYLWSTGATTNCITVSAAGTYSVTVTGVGGCSSVCSATVVVNPLPICTITGNTIICPGQSTQLCTPGGAASYLWSTGATTNCITVNAAGTYSVTVTSANGCSSVCSATVTVSPPPICTISGDISLCTGQSSQICVPAGAFSYLWSTGATTNCITVNGAGTYSVTVTYTGGCSSICSATVTVSPPPSCTITGDISLCTGQSSEICAPTGSGLTYLWNTGATTRCITVSTAGTRSVTVTDANGCSSVCSAAVTVSPPPSCIITGNTVICQGQSTQLCAPTGSGYTYLWSTSATTRCITVSTAGTRSVTVTDANGCSSVCSAAVTVGPGPSCTITGNNILCEGQTTELCAPTGTGLSYLWSTSATTRCITVGAAGTYSVTVTDANGCSSVCSKAVTVGPSPSCTITGNSTICEGQSSQLCAPYGSGLSYLWNTGATTRCVTASATGTYSVTVTNSGGCSSVCSKTLTVSPAPVCTIAGSDTICQKQYAQLCAPTGSGYTYNWDTGSSARCISVDGGGTYHVTVTNAAGCSSTCSKPLTVIPKPSCTITGNNILCEGQTTELCAPVGTGLSYLWSTSATTRCITVSAAGTYSVTVTNPFGCSSNCSKAVTVGPPPSCAINGNTTICEGQSTQLCAPYGSGYTYLWSTGATTKCITITASAPGTYSVTVTNSGGCSSVCSATVTVSPAPACTITGTGTICQKQSTQFCAPEGSGYTYDWDTGSSSRCITVSGPGTYNVTVTNAAGCSSTCSKTLTVIPKPNCTISGNSTICEGQSAQLCAPTGTGYTYLWSTSATTRCVTVSAAGTYYVTVTDANGCSSACSKAVTVGPPPSCAISGNTTICEGQSTQLCAPYGSGYTYLWNTGATTKCITITASVPGTYSVTVTNSGGCSSACSATVTVSPAPACTITGTGTICQKQSTQFCAPEGVGYTYDWDTGSSSRCITVSGQGTYQVTVTNAAGCSSTCSKTLTVIPRPSCNITGSSTICEGGSTELCAPDVSGYTYLWGTGATTRCVTVSSAGTYYVTVTNASGCTKVCSKTVSVGPPPSCAISGSGAICEGQSTQLCAPYGSGYAYLWGTGATSRCITVSTAGTYSVTVTNSGGCSSVCGKDVTVSPAPPCAISGNSTMCEGQTTQLCAPEGAGYTYNWDTGSSARCITVNGQGTYHVTVTNAAGCRSYCSQVVTVVPRPSCNITGSSTICEGGSTELCAPVGTGYTYLWGTGATTRCVTISSAGTYYVTVTNASGCSKVCSKAVTVKPKPTCTITGNFTPPPGQSTTLCAPSGLSSYQWSTGATTKCITVNSSGTYTVTVTNSYGCSSSCSATVTYPAFRETSGGDDSPVDGIITYPSFREASDGDNVPVTVGNIKVRAYPNPFNSKAVIEFQDMQSNSYVVIDLCNVTGNKIATLFDGDVEQGVLYRAEIDAANLPDGIYIYRILNGDQLINRKILLIR